MELTDKREETVIQVEKTQVIRIIDVVVIGPVMIAAATNKHLHPALRISLAVFGVATMVYNGYNYHANLLVKREAEKLKK